MELPTEFVERKRRREKLNAAEQVYVRERAMMSGDAGAENTNFSDPKNLGRKASKLNKQYEQIPVPGNAYEHEE